MMPKVYLSRNSSNTVRRLTWAIKYSNSTPQVRSIVLFPTAFTRGWERWAEMPLERLIGQQFRVHRTESTRPVHGCSGVGLQGITGRSKLQRSPEVMKRIIRKLRELTRYFSTAGEVNDANRSDMPSRSSKFERQTQGDEDEVEPPQNESVERAFGQNSLRRKGTDAGRAIAGSSKK